LSLIVAAVVVVGGGGEVGEVPELIEIGLNKNLILN
jgi:hypothetical protein